MKTETNRQLAERVLGNVDARLTAAQYQAQTLAERLERVGAMWTDRAGTLTACIRAAQWVAQDAAAGVR